MPAELDVVSYLEAKGHYARLVSGGTEAVYPCFFDCQELPNSKKKKLYVNVEDGFYSCKVCGSRGGTYTLQQHFGDDPRAGSSESPFVRRQILDWATDLGTQMLENNDEVLLYLMVERGLNYDTIVERKLGYVGRPWSLVHNLPEKFSKEQLATTGLVNTDGPRAGSDYFYSHILIPYRVREHTVSMRGRGWNVNGAKYLTGKGDPVRMYNSDSLEGAEEVVVCEGEFDAIVLAQHLAEADTDRLKNMAVIGLAGTDAVPDEFWSAMKDMKRVYLAFDSDEPGRKAATRIKEKIGATARILTLPYNDDAEDATKNCDFSDYLLPLSDDRDEVWMANHPYAGHTWRDVATLIAQASGKRIKSIAQAGAEFRARRQRGDGIRIGWRDYDQVVGEMHPGQVMVILARTGVGKSLALCNIAYNTRAIPQLIVTLEMTAAEMYDRLSRIALFHDPYLSDYQIDAELSNIYICDENRLREADLSLLVNEYEVETGVKMRMMQIDYLGYLARGFPGNSSYEKVGNAIMAVKAIGKEHSLLMIVPAQVNRTNKDGKPIDVSDARDAGTIEETADFLVSMYRPDDTITDEYGNAKPPKERTNKIMSHILKSRHGGKGHQFALQMDLTMLAIVDAESPLARRAVEHNHLAVRGYELSDILRRDTLGIQTSLKVVGA